MYLKDIFMVPYELLKIKGIKVIIFDLDNTLIDKNHDVFDAEVKKLLLNLQKSFQVYILSNSVRRKRIKKIVSDFPCRIVGFALKPTCFGFLRIKDLKNYESNQVCLIGDQLVTDIFGAKKRNYFSILVDYQVEDIEKLTSINRIIEKRLFKKYNIRRGNYYD